MEKAINSILVGGEDVEIIVVNDGSKDGTQEIAERYQEKYPTIVKAVAKPNGGHGDAVNCGLEHATGKYFKVVDSDDWVDEEALLKVLDTIKGFVKDESEVDMVIANYVYEKVGMTHKKVIRYDNVLPENQIFKWEDIGRFRLDQYILMHSVIYRTKLLRECGLKLPEHTFYVDNLFAYCPLPYVRNIFYMDIDLYQYYLGRDDQSVNEQMLKKRIDQQMKVTRMVIAGADLTKIKEKEPKLASYMYRNISIMMAISSIHLLLIGNEEALEKRKNLWGEIKTSNPKLYYKLKYASLSGWTDLPGAVGRRLTLAVTVLRMQFTDFSKMQKIEKNQKKLLTFPQIYIILTYVIETRRGSVW